MNCMHNKMKIDFISRKFYALKLFQKCIGCVIIERNNIEEGEKNGFNNGLQQLTKQLTKMCKQYRRWQFLVKNGE